MNPLAFTPVGLSNHTPSILLADFLIELPIRRNSHGPIKLVTHGLGKHLFDWDLVALTEGNRYPRIHVVQLSDFHSRTATQWQGVA